MRRKALDGVPATLDGVAGIQEKLQCLAAGGVTRESMCMCGVWQEALTCVVFGVDMCGVWQEAFRQWADRVECYDPSLVVSTCHNYDIKYKFNYECRDCGHAYGRHTRSIDVAAQSCGQVCAGVGAGAGVGVGVGVGRLVLKME